MLELVADPEKEEGEEKKEEEEVGMVAICMLFAKDEGHAARILEGVDHKLARCELVLVWGSLVELDVTFDADAVIAEIEIELATPRTTSPTDVEVASSEESGIAVLRLSVTLDARD